MKPGKFNVLLDQAWGSSGKGSASTRLADLFDVKHVSSANYPNAGHTVVNSVSGDKFVAKAIPTAAILKKIKNSNIQIWISPGSGFFWKQLIKEWFETGKPIINIHDRASIVTEDHARREREGADSTKHIASTMQGTAAAISDKILRKADVQLAGSFKYDNMSPTFSIAKFLFLSDPDIHNMFGDMSVVDEFAEKVQVLSAWNFRIKSQDLIMKLNTTWLHEGSQGYALSIDHGNQFPNCLSAESRVLMADGNTYEIRDLETRIGQEVISKTTDGKLINKKILNWWRNSMGDREWYNIITETSVYNKHDQQWIGPKFTSDHKIQTTKGTKKISELVAGDKIFTTESELTGDGLQILLGSLLGDGSIPAMKKHKRRAKLEISHCEKQNEYLLGKAEILTKYIKGSIRKYVYTDNSFKPGAKYARFSSSASISIMKLATKFGCFGKKKPNFELIIQEIDWRGLAIWFQDDGSFKQGGNGKDVILFTNGFEEEDVRYLAKLLEDKFGLHFSIDMTKKKDSETRMPTLRLSRHDQTKWFEGIQNFMSPCMQYKLPDGMQAKWAWKDHTKIICTTEIVMDVVKCRTRPHRGESVCFDIEIEDTHNFFVANDKGFFNVENCTSRNCSLQAAMDYMAIPPSYVGDVYLNLRTFPIRVGNVVEDGIQKGYSGDAYPDCRELTWEEVARISGMPKEEADKLAERERTTVTKRIRRVFNFSFLGLRDAVQTNGATKLIVNFIQYLNWKDAGLKGGKEALQKLSSESRAFITKLEEASNIPVVMIGTGADHSEFVNLL